MDGVDSCIRGIVWDSPQYAGNKGVEALNGAHDWVDGAALGPEIHFYPIFLIHECDCNVFCESDIAGLSQEALLPVAEDNMTNVECLRAALFAGCGVLTGAHCEKESHNGEVGC